VRSENAVAIVSLATLAALSDFISARVLDTMPWMMLSSPDPGFYRAFPYFKKRMKLQNS
jgi:hypothetical protein